MTRTGMSKGRPNTSSLKIGSPFSSSFAPVSTPEELNEIGARFWQSVFTSARWLDPALDSYLVLEAALLAQDMAEARAEIRANGRYQSIPNGSTVRSAAVVDLEKLQVQQNAYLSALGLTPSDRARLGLAGYREDNVLVELERRREERRLAMSQKP